MRINRLEQALVAAGMTALLGCNVTLGELKAINPRAATLEVPCRPAIVPENVKVMAVQSESGHIVTDEDQDELLEFARLAGVFIKFNNSAPKENAAIMASEYGLSCPNLSSTKQSSPAPFRSEEPCSSEAAQSNGRANANLLGDVGKAPCDSSGQTKEAKKAPVRVKVCVRPPWVPKPHKDAKGNWVTVTEWAIVLGNKKVEWTKDPKRYAEQVAQYADVIFVLDESAPLESVYYFTKDPKKLSCPGGAPRKSYDQVAGSIDMPMLSEVTAAREAKEQADAEKAAAGNGNGKGQTSSTNPNGKGDGKTTDTSSPDGKGPPLDPFETVARELVFAGKLTTGDVSDPATVAEGSRHGMPGGKNAGGFSFPVLQAGVGLVSIVIGVGMKPQDFIKKVVEKTGIGKPVIVKELNADALRIADELVAEYGQYVMAESVRKQKIILPFKMAQKFTEKLESKFQAHKIFERRAIKRFKIKKAGLSDEAIEKAVDAEAAKYPSIILTEEQHRLVSDALNAAWKKAPPTNLAELRKIYVDVYKTDAHWLQAIESYLR